MTASRENFAGCVIAWQKEHGRNRLPWQQSRDPYRVWLSEIMLQQTQVATVLGYFARFLERLPDVQALAAASPDTVAALWSGLGYYSRARNLHRCAQAIVAQFDGEFPRTAKALETLPGIGRSTAGAIASFCFGERVPILDANVKRALTRVLAFEADLARAANERLLWEHATALLPVGSADALWQDMPRYTQGMMDLGASVCLPQRPHCLVCPVNAMCDARAQGRPEAFPVRTRLLKRTAEAWWLLVQIDPRRGVWLERRPPSGIWAGLHCTPVFASAAEADLALPSGEIPVELPAFTHVLTHKDLHLHPLMLRVAEGFEPAGEGVWVPLGDIAAVGLPAPLRKLFQSIDWSG